jgi:hypothetical protein
MDPVSFCKDPELLRQLSMPGRMKHFPAFCKLLGLPFIQEPGSIQRAAIGACVSKMITDGDQDAAKMALHEVWKLSSCDVSSVMMSYEGGRSDPCDALLPSEISFSPLWLDVHPHMRRLVNLDPHFRVHEIIDGPFIMGAKGFDGITGVNRYFWCNSTSETRRLQLRICRADLSYGEPLQLPAMGVGFSQGELSCNSKEIKLPTGSDFVDLTDVVATRDSNRRHTLHIDIGPQPFPVVAALFVVERIGDEAMEARVNSVFPHPMTHDGCRRKKGFSVADVYARSKSAGTHVVCPICAQTVRLEHLTVHSPGVKEARSSEEARSSKKRSRSEDELPREAPPAARQATGQRQRAKSCQDADQTQRQIEPPDQYQPRFQYLPPYWWCFNTDLQPFFHQVELKPRYEPTLSIQDVVDMFD